MDHICLQAKVEVAVAKAKAGKATPVVAGLRFV
jgi:hypothetical protein